MVPENKREGRPVYVESGNLLIRVAETDEEVSAAQALRYRVFYEEMSAKPTARMMELGRDLDNFDEYCDHLLVIDRSLGAGDVAVVGTYRFLRRSAAKRCGQFYTSAEYDIGPLIAYPGEIMELGRSCVHPEYRTGATMVLLWRGIAEYCYHYKIELMFGCGSLPGTDIEANRLSLAYLHKHHLAPEVLRPRALKERFVDISNLPASEEELLQGRQMLPPLIKGYLRLGGIVGEGAVIDYEFGTTDVCIVVKTAQVTEKYYRHYHVERLWEEDEQGRIRSERNKRRAG
jgi:putative hemolysin